MLTFLMYVYRYMSTPDSTHRYIGVRNSYWAEISDFLMAIYDCRLDVLVMPKLLACGRESLKSLSLRRVSIQKLSSQISQLSSRQNDIILPDTNLRL